MSCGNRREIFLSDEIPPIEFEREARMLTSFYGLDTLPRRARLIDRKAPGLDGMPVVFSLEINPETLDASDFEVISALGNTYSVSAVSFMPANEAFELRTVLLMGEYARMPEDPPITVKIVGDLMSRTGKNHKGQSISVIPLEDGPIISYAEYFNFDHNYPYKEKGRGCDCPKEAKMVVRTVWSGGVRGVDGEEPSQELVKNFEVRIVKGRDTVSVQPFKLADLGDGDNNLDLCLDQEGEPIWVQADKDILIDPRDDLNPVTGKEILSRW